MARADGPDWIDPDTMGSLPEAQAPKAKGALMVAKTRRFGGKVFTLISRPIKGQLSAKKFARVATGGTFFHRLVRAKEGWFVYVRKKPLTRRRR